MISVLWSLVRRAWYTRRHNYVLGMPPGVLPARWGIPYPLILFRDGQRVAHAGAAKIQGRLVVSLDQDGRICEVWYKE